MVLPVLTNPAAAITISGVTRLRVPARHRAPSGPSCCASTQLLDSPMLGVTFLF